MSESKFSSLKRFTNLERGFKRALSTISAFGTDKDEDNFQESQPTTSRGEFNVSHYDANGYSSLDQLEQPTRIDVTNTASTSSPSIKNNVGVIYAKPNKTKEFLTNADNEDNDDNSDEIVELSLLEDDCIPLQSPVLEPSRVIDSLQTLRSINFHHSKHKLRTLWTKTVDDPGNYIINCGDTTIRVQEDADTLDVALQTDDYQEFEKSELLRQIENLQQIINRLVEELKHYQANTSIDKLTTANYYGHITTWPIDTQYLMPLFIAYDKKLQEKDEIIKDYKLKTENSQADANLFPKQQDWKKLYEESEALIKKKDCVLQKTQFEQSEQKRKMQKLAQNHSSLKNQNKQLMLSLKHLRSQNATFRKNNNKLMTKLRENISRKKHEETVASLRKAIIEIKRSKNEQVKEFTDKVEILEEKQILSSDDIRQLRAEKCQVEGRNLALKNMIKSIENKSILYKTTLDGTIEQFAGICNHLVTIESVLEKSVTEKELFLNVITYQQQETERLMKQALQGKLTTRKLEERLKKYKVKLSKKLNKVSTKMIENKKSSAIKHARYKGELAKLVALLNDRREKIKLLDDSKNSVERDLELVWQIANMENQLFLKKDHNE